MATHILAEVLEFSRATGGDRLVMIALADQASRETRVAHVSIALLVRHTRMSDRSVQRSLRRNLARGEITLVSPTRGGRTTTSDSKRENATYAGRYRIADLRTKNGDILSGFSAPETPTSDPENPDICDKKTPTSATDTNSVNYSNTSQPAGLDESAWARWVEYRQQIGKAIKAVSIPAARRKLATFGVNQLAVVEHSIANGYQGLFPPTEQVRGRGPAGGPTSSREAVDREGGKVAPPSECARCKKAKGKIPIGRPDGGRDFFCLYCYRQITDAIRAEARHPTQ